ncbi:MAG: carboxypeptidase-like regulatory domain-containing protein [Blastocatellia bacterium]
MRRIVSLFSILILGLTLTALAQEFRATISGDVVDESGSPVEGAKVVVTNIEKNTTTETITNSSGRYVVQFLPPGKYQVAVEKSGFKKFVRGEIVLSAADRIAIDVKLEVGAVTENTQVTAVTPLLQTETASRTATIENRMLENIPTSGRNLYQLQYTLPGVIKNSTYWGSMELYAFGNVNNVSISGGRSGENETLIDGVANTHADRGVTLVPSLNSTQEFTIHTNTYDAQFGRVGGGVTSITLKSGTNALHGQLFEFFKNEKLNANDWIANKNNEARTKYWNNTFGFEVDGPVYIPKLFDGRNRAFFMISLEGLRERQEQPLVTSLPTAEMLRGDFSKLTDNAGNLITIYDPLTTRLNPNYDPSKQESLANPRYIRDAFQNNIIPPDRINPIAAKAASFYPQPNRPSDDLDNLKNYAVFNPARNGYDAWLGKMDFHLAQDHQVSFRYGQTPWSNFAQIAWGTNAAEPSGEAPSTRVSRNWGADWVYNISPSLVFNLRGGLARFEAFSGNIFAGGFDPKELGFSASLVSQFTALQFPRLEVGTPNQPYSPLGATRVSNYETHDTWSLQPNLSWNRGSHLRKMGFEFRLYN